MKDRGVEYFAALHGLLPRFLAPIDEKTRGEETAGGETCGEESTQESTAEKTA